MILAIDTSSAQSAVALLDPDRNVVQEVLKPSGRELQLPATYRALRGTRPLTKVAVATGPGSFTGLRVGVSFGVGLAIGLGVPIVPLSTLGIQAERSGDPVTAVSEAGRGRVYLLAPGSQAALADVSDVPAAWPLVGWLRPATQAALVAAGARLKPDRELRTFGAAVARLLESATEVAYGSLELEYMQSFGARF